MVLVICLAGITDFLDGYLARRFEAISRLGRFLDPLADKVFCNSVIWGLYFFNYSSCPVLLLTIAIPLTVRDLLLIFGFLVALFKRIKVEVEPVYISKLCTFLIFVFTISSILSNRYNIFLTFIGLGCVILIFWSGFTYCKRLSSNKSPRDLD
jgi:cardiolipin synthase